MIFSLKENLLTKEEINRRITDQQIYEFYLKEELRLNKKYHSPYRTDKNPSLSVFESTKGDLLWRDWGDPTMSKANGVVSLIQKIHGNCSYYEALRYIDQDMGLGIEKTAKLIGNSITIPQERKLEKKEKRTKIIEIETQSYTAADVKYWNRYHIPVDVLLMYNVYSCKYVWVDKVLVRTYSNTNPTYAYRLSTVNGIKLYKIYSPLAIRGGKWLTNAGSETVQGISNLSFIGDNVIITKSLKDVMVLHMLGYESIALQNEGAKVPGWVISILRMYYKNTFVLYDNDIKGKIESEKLVREHNYFKIEIPDYLREENIKDISDYVEKYGRKKGRLLISNLIAFEKAKLEDYDLPF